LQDLARQDHKAVFITSVLSSITNLWPVKIARVQYHWY